MTLSEKNIRQRSIALVISFVGEKMADQWWLSPNRHFDDTPPALQWIKDPESVYRYLMSQISGDFY